MIWRALLGRLIANGTGQSLHGYFRAKVFDSLGISACEWMAVATVSRRGRPGCGCCHGMWRASASWCADGENIVPAAWVEDMLRLRLNTDWGGRYGYQWSSESLGGHPFVAAMGNGGQRLYAVPDLRLSAVVTADNYDDLEHVGRR